MFQKMDKINVFLCTFVSSWALARLSTAMAKKTLRSVSVVELKSHKHSLMDSWEEVMKTWKEEMEI